MKRKQELILDRVLPYSHISTGIEQTIDFIKGRRDGKVPSLKTSKNKFNDVFLDGVDWFRILTIAGLSGSGKSTILEEFKRDFFELNPQQDFEMLSFEFEMRIEDQLARSIAPKLGISVKEMYSQSWQLSEDKLKKVIAALNSKPNRPQFYINEIGSVTEVEKTILQFVEDRQLVEKNKGIVITLDHALLTKGKMTDKEKDKIDELMHAFVAMKQYFSSIGLKCIFIVLSQLNRDIESNERILNPYLHYPKKNDIFAASSVYYCSDYVMVTHKPANIPGMREHYGPPIDGWPFGLPVYSPKDNKTPMIYWHIIKERFGEPTVLMMLDDLKNSQVLEY